MLIRGNNFKLCISTHIVRFLFQYFLRKLTPFTGTTYIICGFIFVAIVCHAYRLLRHFRPKFGLAICKVPGFARGIALLRCVSYRHFRPIGPFHIPSMKYCLVLGSFGIATTVWTFTIMPYYQKKSSMGGTLHFFLNGS